VSRRVLVVDDEPDVREMLEAVLGGEGYQVTTVPDGETALAAARSTRFDLATMDLRMPGMSGREALAALREIDPQLPVLVISGYATPEEATACLALGAIAVVSKPFGVASLLERIDRALAGGVQPAV
jgi:CheY-like chemotaxis protein